MQSSQGMCKLSDCWINVLRHGTLVGFTLSVCSFKVMIVTSVPKPWTLGIQSLSQSPLWKKSYAPCEVLLLEGEAADCRVFFLVPAPTAVLLSAELCSYSTSTWRPMVVGAPLHEVFCKTLPGLGALQVWGSVQGAPIGGERTLSVLLVKAGLCSKQRCFSVLGFSLSCCAQQPQEPAEWSITCHWGMNALGHSSNGDRHSAQYALVYSTQIAVVSSKTHH